MLVKCSSSQRASNLLRSRLWRGKCQSQGPVFHLYAHGSQTCISSFVLSVGLRPYTQLPASSLSSQSHRHLKPCVQNQTIDEKQMFLPQFPPSEEMSASFICLLWPNLSLLFDPFSHPSHHKSANQQRSYPQYTLSSVVSSHLHQFPS